MHRRELLHGLIEMGLLRKEAAGGRSTSYELADS
jgi:hypothetical protein